METTSFKPRIGWQDSRGWGFCLLGLYCLLAVSPVIVAWLAAEPIQMPVLTKIALAMAMTGFSLLCLQVILAGRFKTFDRPCGLDVVMLFHKKMALLATVLLVLHPVLLAVEHKSLALFGFDTSWKVYLGKGALVFLLAGVLFALYFSKLQVDYNVWRFFHKAMVAVVILGFFHGLVIGPHMEQSSVVRVYWYVMFIAAAGIFGFRNLVVPFIRRKFNISSVRQETHNTYTLTFEPEDGEPIHRNPGQFMFLKLIRPGRSSELHPFTISASPLDNKILQASIKKSGDFTNTIDQTKPGDIGRIEAAFGRFSYVYHNPEKILFIAGGVGITPIMSMLRCLRGTDDKREVVLLYGNNTEQDIIFREEMENLGDNFKVVHVLSKPGEQWQGEKGYVTGELIEKHAGGMLKQAHVYLCGPPVMMDKVLSALRSLNVDDKRIHYERFTI